MKKLIVTLSLLLVTTASASPSVTVKGYTQVADQKSNGEYISLEEEVTEIEGKCMLYSTVTGDKLGEILNDPCGKDAVLTVFAPFKEDCHAMTSSYAGYMVKSIVPNNELVKISCNNEDYLYAVFAKSTVLKKLKSKEKEIKAQRKKNCIARCHYTKPRATPQHCEAIC